MKDNFFDLVLNITHEDMNLIIERIAQEFKNVRPLDKTQISDDEILYYYDTLGLQDKINLRQKYGDDLIGEYIFDIEQLRSKKNAKR